jgi:hypothetical protein
MRFFHRRALFAFAILPAFLFAGCSSTSGNGTTPTQVLADASAIVNALGNAVTQIGVQSPGLIPDAQVTQIKSYIADANSLLGSLSASTAANESATVLNQVCNDVESVLVALTKAQNLPPQYVSVVQAAAVVLPIVQAFVNATLGVVNPTPAPAAVSASQSHMSVEQARHVLGER